MKKAVFAHINTQSHRRAVVSAHGATVQLSTITAALDSRNSFGCHCRGRIKKTFHQETF